MHTYIMDTIFGNLEIKADILHVKDGCFIFCRDGQEVHWIPVDKIIWVRKLGND